MIATTCFGLLRPSSGFPPKEYQCFVRFMLFCHDGEISLPLVFIIIIIIIINIKKRGCGGVRDVGMR